MSESEPVPIAAEETPQPVPKGGRGELFAFALVAIVATLVTLAVLMGRRTASDVVAAARADASVPAAASPAVASRHPADPTLTWSREHQEQWVGKRRRSAAFELPADNTVAIWLGRVRPILVVRCVERKTEAFVFTGSAIKIEPRSEDHTVTFGFDDGAEVSQRWPDSAEHDALFAPDGAAFTAQLTHARTLRFGYTPHNAMPVVAQFHVSGLGPLLDPVARECGATP